MALTVEADKICDGSKCSVADDMAVIWLLLGPGKREQRLWQVLAGNFAVRIFGSEQSLLWFAKLAKLAEPELIIDALMKDPSQALAFASDIAKLFENTRVVDAVRSEQYLDPFELVSFINSQSKDSCARAYPRVDLERLEFCISCNESISIAGKEARILTLLCRRPGGLVSRAEIMRHVWYDVAVSPRTIDAHVSKLRKKLEHSPFQVQNCYGRGYYLADNSEMR